MSHVLQAIADSARRTPERACLTAPGRTITWIQLVAAVGRLADRLARERGPVALALDNGPDWVIADLALVQSGRPSVPLPPFFTPEQRHHVLADCGAQAVLARTEADQISGLDLSIIRTGLPERNLPAMTAKVTYTSGSTGTPKGVCLSQEQMECVAGSLVEVLGARYAGVHLPILPLGVLLENVAGLYSTLLAGGRYHAPGLADVGQGQPFRPDFARMLGVIGESRATSLILVPELLRGLIAAKLQLRADLPDLNLVAVGGARVAPALLAGALSAGLPVVEGYGLTECASVVSLNIPGDNAPGTVGRPLPHLQVHLAADGGILVGPDTFLGYVGEPPHWGDFATGDIGAFDAEGRLRIEGRKSNRLITAFGRNVSPEWVESELTAEPQILQALVFGEAQPHLGALIVPTSPAADLGGAVARVNARLPEYARIERWRPVPPFDPRKGQLTGNGRPRREVILQTYAELVGDPV